jgi:DNA modification methylase
MIHLGNCLDILPTLEAGSVQTCVTSPPYFGLRDYGMADQIGLEATPDDFVAAMVAVFREVRRVLRDDGTLWLNLGDSYSTESKWGGSTSGKAAAGIHGSGGGGRAKIRHGIRDKNLLGIPWRVAFALQADGWYLRQDIIWSKPNPMPESVRDRCTKAHEYLFLLSKSPRYYFDAEAIAEPVAESTIARLSQPKIEQQTGSDRVPGKTNGNMKAVGNGETRNKRSVWSVATKPFKGAHFATFPVELVEPCILAGSRPGDLVLDPFMGAGTTAVAASMHGRSWVGCELNPEYHEIANERLHGVQSRIAI